MRILSCAAVLLVLFGTLAVPAFAEELWIVDPDSAPVLVSEDGTQTPFSSETESNPAFSLLEEDPAAPDAAADAPEDDPVSSDPEEAVVTMYSVMSVADLNEAESGGVSSSEDASMRDVVIQVFGEYSPRTQTVTQYLSDGSLLGTTTEIVPGVAGMDWTWISGVLLFALVLASFLKLVGVLLKHG